MATLTPLKNSYCTRGCSIPSECSKITLKSAIESKGMLEKSLTEKALKDMPSSKQSHELHGAIRQRDILRCQSLIGGGADVNGIDKTGVSPLLVACEIGKTDIVKCLIDNGAEINFKKSNGTTPLHVASASGRLTVLELLIKGGAKVDAVTSGSTTSLFVASAAGHAALVKKLCEAGADIDQQNHRGWTPLHAACQFGNPDAIEVLLCHGSDVEAVTAGTCSTPLHVAAMNGNLEAVELLIGKDTISKANLRNNDRCYLDVGRASLDARQADNFTPLMLACNAGMHAIVQMLLKKGADPNAVGGNLRTAAHSAAVGGHAQILKELLDHGADINATSDSGSTPLLLATNGGHTEAVEVLVSRKAKIYDDQSTKPSAVLVATQRGYVKIVEIFLKQLGLAMTARAEPKPLLNIAALFGHLAIVKLLIDFGADPLVSERERTMNALHEASLKGRLDIVRYLLSLGMEVDVRTSSGETPLHLAAKSGHVDVAEYLLKHGADVGLYRATGHSALHFAAARGDIPLARLLLDAGADIEATKLEAASPLFIAAERGQMYMTRFLLKRGAEVNRHCTDQSKTPLHAASAMGHLAVIEALLTAGADLHAKNAFLQSPEDVVGSKKTLTVVERGLIESTFNRHKKHKTRRDAKKKQRHDDTDKALPGSKATLKTQAATHHHHKPRCHETPREQDCTGSKATPDPKPEEEIVLDEPSSPSPEVHEFLSNYMISPRDTESEPPSATGRRKPSIVDQIAARRHPEGFRLFDIKEFKSSNSHDTATVHSDGKQAKTRPRRPSFGWSRLNRQPGSARAVYRHSATESPRKAPVIKSDSRRLSRSGSIPASDLSSHHSKSSSVSKIVHFPSATASSKSTQMSRDPLPDAVPERRTSRVLKRFAKSRRSSSSQDIGDKFSVHSVQSESNCVDSKGRSNLFVAANHGNISTVEKLLAMGMDPNVRVEEHGWTPLYAASRHGHVEIVQKLIDYGAATNKNINSGATALHGACASGQEQVARVLIEYGARLDATTKNGELPLHTAARNGYMHVVSLLLATDESLINRKRYSDGSTALHLAVEKQWAGVVKELIDWGANPNVSKEDGITPLYLTSISGNKSIAQMILNSPGGFDVNIQTDENWTALHVACARGDLDMVRLLLRSGADPTLKTNMDMTPGDVICEWVTADGGRSQRIREIIERPPTETSYLLVEAASQGDLKRVKTLVDEGADMNVFGEEGLTPLLSAVRNGQISTVHFLVLREARINLPSCPGFISALHYAALGEAYSLVEFLLSNGADVRNQDDTGQTALHYASHKGFTMAISVLLAYRADVHANDKHGKTPLYMAAASDRHEAVALLLRNQAYPSCATADGSTPLHAAVTVGGAKTAHLLLSSRCDPNARNARKETPLFLAAKNGYSGIVKRLLTHDISINTQDYEGNSALHAACMYGHAQVVEVLLQNPDIDLKLKNKKGMLCNEVIGDTAEPGLNRRDREHIVALLLNRIRNKQNEEVAISQQHGTTSEFICNIDSFKCPITKNIMKNPVVASDGYTYEYDSISEWIKKRGTSPVTGMKLSHILLQRNQKLKSKIDMWRASQR